MAKQTFTAGQVLTATQMNNLQANDYNWSTNAQTASYVLVAADAGKTVTMNNAGATTITVNSALFAAGDTVRILNVGAGVTTITAGTATVNCVGPLVLTQYASGTLWFSSASASVFIPDDAGSGLCLVKTQAVGSGVSTVTVTNGFNSTFANYVVILSGGTNSLDATISLRLGASATGYYGFLTFGNATGAGTVLGAANNNGTAADFVGGAIAGQAAHVYCTVLGPNLASYTKILGGSYQSGNNYGTSQTEHRVATAYTDFTLIPTAGTFTGGTIRVYGFQNG